MALVLVSPGGAWCQEGSEAGSPHPDQPVAAQFTWADVDGDGRLELGALSSEGKLRLLADAGGESFEDATERLGLSGVEDVALVLWKDYDRDDRIDLFVGARSGRSRLFRNEGGVLADWSAAAGIALEGAVQSAAWLDHDGDGRLDLTVVTAEGSTLCMSLFRGLEGGFFEQTELTELTGTALPLPAGPVVAPERDPSAASAGEGGSARGNPAPGERMPEEGPSAAGSPLIALPIPVGCAETILDQDDSGCMGASSTPTLGMLYPISSDLFVAVAGDVGIGTTTPAAKLDVAGTARITNTLTLSPPGDQALSITAGSIYKDGTLFLHTKGTDNVGAGREALMSVTTGVRNAALGKHALRNNTSGNDNTAVGNDTLLGNTTGNRNTAIGRYALRANTTGSDNSASGWFALFNNTIGNRNTAIGSSALRQNTTGYLNTAVGSLALTTNSTGLFNTASGGFALLYNTTGSRNTASGYASLNSNTIGIDNTASGTYALRDNTTGSYNTASGSGALRSNTTGNNNTGSGFGALRSNTTGHNNTASGLYALRDNTAGFFNTANGSSALRSNTTGTQNAANGVFALAFNTTGSDNMASGVGALYFNTTGSTNTASGSAALRTNTTGGANTASGSFSLFNNTTGNQNTAIGTLALFNNTTGARNVAVGPYAGNNLTTGNDNIAIGNQAVAGEAQTIRVGTAGTHTRAFIAGIRGATTGVANAIPVLIDSNGQLGTVSSSRRFKEEIRDMGELTERLLVLRPVVFRYKPEVQSGERPLEYGLIAEEVAEVFPELVVFDEEGKPFTVKYHLLSSMLLNELQRLSEAYGVLEERDAAREFELADVLERLAALEERGHARVAAPAALAR
jgi:hypothetical protein